ncbi:MAG: hypothetical protein JWN79_955 [Gemmatimonadetes bacterium]|jgi:hypothetical protein|nr:hypothetical protein [Gemmatimonadota bacterium]
MTSPSRDTRMATDDGRSSPLSIALAWLAVGIPLAWGVSQTIIKSMALFR